jgi:hypothetical protein
MSGRLLFESAYCKRHIYVTYSPTFSGRVNRQSLVAAIFVEDGKKLFLHRQDPLQAKNGS